MTGLARRSGSPPREVLPRREWNHAGGGIAQGAWLRGAVQTLLSSRGAGWRSLGPASIAGAVVVPIVELDEKVVTARAQAGQAPALDRLSLRGRIEAGGVGAKSPVLDAAFVGVWGRAGLTPMARLGGYGRAVLMVARGEGVDPLELAECDWRGIGVASIGINGEIEWLVPSTFQGTGKLTTMRYEQLLDLALHK